MDKNTFFQYKENQAHAGYRSAILYKEQGDVKYRFLCASETVPFPFGEKEALEFNLLNSEVIGQVEGKFTTEQKSVEMLYTRNNTMLFEKLKGRVLDFMSLTPQMVGYKFNGTISFRPNDATNEIHRGTYTLTPMDVDTTPYYKARTECYMPFFFADTIPDEISLANLDTTAEGISINLNLRGNATEKADFTYTTIGADGKETTPQTITVTNGVGTLPKVEGLYVIYAKPKTANSTDYSPCFTSVYVTE